jgi:serine/threonine protein kinase
MAGMSESMSEDGVFVRYFKDSKDNIQRDYEILDVLGDGAFSIVKRAKKIDNGKVVAIKVIKKEKVAVNDLRKEVDIWRTAQKSSSRVVHVYEIYENERNVYLIMEDC